MSRISNTTAAVRLTKRQQAIIRAIANDLSMAEIADKLGIAEPTVKFHKQRIKAKLGVVGVGGMIRYAIRSGLIKA